MIETITEFFKNAESNKILMAILGGGIFWQVMANIRDILGAIWGAILSCISFTVNSVSVGDYDRPILRYKIEKLLSSSKVLWERHSEIQPSSSCYNESRLMNVAFGRSYRWMWGHFMVLERTYSTQSTKMVVNISARIFFARRKKFIEKLMEEVEKCSLNTYNNTLVVNMGDGIMNERTKRKISSVYTNTDIAEKLYSDVKTFMDSRETYIKSNSPYKFVGLLSGTPGSGKSSTILALASELNMGVRFVNMDKADFETIARIMTHNNDENERNIVVMEDIDCLSMNVDDKRVLPPSTSPNYLPLEDDDDPETMKFKIEHNRASIMDFKATTLSLSSILNLLDGLATPEGAIVFMTTNNPDKLDKALLRDGRVDCRYEFTNFNKDTANRMIFDYLGFRIDNIKDGIVPSSLQRDILKVSIGRMSKEALVDKYSEGAVELAS